MVSVSAVPLNMAFVSPLMNRLPVMEKSRVPILDTLGSLSQRIAVDLPRRKRKTPPYEDLHGGAFVTESTHPSRAGRLLVLDWDDLGKSNRLSQVFLSLVLLMRPISRERGWPLRRRRAQSNGKARNRFNKRGFGWSLGRLFGSSKGDSGSISRTSRRYHGVSVGDHGERLGLGHVAADQHAAAIAGSVAEDAGPRLISIISISSNFVKF
jgi:hypothetical protein